MHRRTRKVFKLLVITLLLFVLSGLGQDYQLRMRLDLVVVPVTVKAAGDRLVTGLTQDDFIVFEDGAKQRITNFTTDPVPLSAAVLVDTGLSAGSLSKVQKTFPALAGAFSDFDEVAVYRFDNFVAKVLDFSKDNTVIETAMKTLSDAKPSTNTYPASTRGPFSTPGPVINGAPVIPPGQVGVITTAPPKNIKVLNDAIFAAASDLAKRDRERRKIVLVISDGTTTGSDHSFDETVRSLLDTGIQVYAIGLEQTFLTRKSSILNDYAKTTGGDAFFANSVPDIEKFYARAAEQARNQYVLGYVSSNKVPGTLAVFRDVQVKVAGGGLEALHRKGYYQYP